eukprot:CAMPEP_0117437792 /NCGR_PEP_ID=MMETSP0759-20121206/1714_1 /TAXON_ID=63605 /ORGANISM="Percolomonas cosmopolitus, Strain WS" /LENGTH=34 /DNA_ID= /DNA_START= /DNA_END= /DNA_ORIENTATION=
MAVQKGLLNEGGNGGNEALVVLRVNRSLKVQPEP